MGVADAIQELGQRHGSRFHVRRERAAVPAGGRTLHDESVGAGGDGQTHSVIVNGSNGSDRIVVANNVSNGIKIGGLAARVNISGLDAGLDQLTVNALGGNDRVDATGLVGGVVGGAQLLGGGLVARLGDATSQSGKLVTGKVIDLVQASIMPQSLPPDVGIFWVAGTFAVVGIGFAVTRVMREF